MKWGLFPFRRQRGPGVVRTTYRSLSQWTRVPGRDIRGDDGPTGSLVNLRYFHPGLPTYSHSLLTPVYSSSSPLPPRTETTEVDRAEGGRKTRRQVGKGFVKDPRVGHVTRHDQ